MNKKNNLITIFHNLKFGLLGLSLLLLVAIGATVFTEFFGGNFPDRTRGPLAHEKFYQLGMLPEWEDIIMEKFPDDGKLKNRLELMIEGKEFPPLEFGQPSPTPEEVEPTTEENLTE